MNTLKVTSKGDFTDTVLQSGKIERRLGLISDELPIDTLTLFVYKEVASQKVQYLLDKNLKPLVSSDGHFLAVKRSTGNVIDGVVPGDEIIVYYTYPAEGNSYPGTEVKLGQFFVEKVETVNSILFKISCYSYLGILNKSVHEGGVYTNYSALDLIDELTYPARAYGFTYTVDPDITTLDDTLSGWLPYGNCAGNLLHVLFATGWILVPNHGYAKSYILTTPGKESWSIPNTNPSSAKFYSEGRKSIYDQTGVSRLDNAEKVRLVEHAYFSSPADKLVTLYDNSADTAAASNAIVVFNEPCHGTFTTTGTLTAETHDNYAIVSGNGTLTGYAYSHSQRQLEADTNVINNGKVISVENETLVSFTNSKNVLERLVNNQNANQSASVKYRPIPLGTGYFNQIGDKLTFRDMNNSPVTGHVNSTDYVMSAFPSINADMLLGFIPGPYGMSVNAYVMFEGAGGHSWTVPTGVTEITAVLIGGGEGGTGGNGGNQGGNGVGVSGLISDNPVATGGVGGNGGTGGTGGNGGKIYTVPISVTPGATVSINIGSGGIGGDGGARNGGAGDPGTLGGDTEIVIGGSTYSSASGSVLPTGYSNPLTGETYGVGGGSGGNGGKGGGANQSNRSQPGGFGSGDNGEDVYEIYNGDTDHRTYYRLYGYGGGGGGGTYSGGGLGTSGGDGDVRINTQAVQMFRAYGGDGGVGADGDTATLINTNAGCGGEGGEGGGGGGGGGGAKVVWGEGDWTSECYLEPGTGSRGGSGGGGSNGADGGVIIYYRAS